MTKSWRCLSAAAIVLPVAFILPGCGSGNSGNDPASGEVSTASTTELVGTKWEWLRTVTPVERIEAVDPERYSITLDAAGSVTAQFDCNSGRGTFETADYGITFGAFIATRMACPDDTQDFLFMSHLEKVSTYFIDDGELFMEMPFDSGTMRFRSAESID